MEDLQRLKNGRTPVRGQITKLTSEVMSLCEAESPNSDIILEKLELIKVYHNSLNELNNKVTSALLDIDGTTEQIMEQEYNSITEYEAKIVRARRNANKILEQGQIIGEHVTRAQSISSEAPGVGRGLNYHLPRIEIPVFSGEVKDWLGWWTEFKQVDEEPAMPVIRKLTLLKQHIAKGTRADEIVKGFQTTETNYPKAVEALKRRFGRDELQVEVNVRELLRIVEQISKGKGKITLTTIYDKLQIHLSALESLKVTSDKCATILYPLVTSCVPEGTLQAGHRNPLSKMEEDENNPSSSRLQRLLEFLREEVEGEERITLARQGFTSVKVSRNYVEEEVPTAFGLVSSNLQVKCIFCEGLHHAGLCAKAINMAHDEKMRRIFRNRVCLACLNTGHNRTNCTENVKCAICSKNHYVNMCAAREQKVNKRQFKARDRRSNPKLSAEENGHEGTSTEMACNAASGNVLLQTLLVKIGPQGRIARLVFDSGSQRTYIKKTLASDVGLVPIGEESIQHELFGGLSTDVTSHKQYGVRIKSLNSEKFVFVRAIDQEKICGTIPRLTKGPWLKKLVRKRIWIDDFGDNPPEIEILIGADNHANFMTGKTFKLSSGLAAHETVLGWTLLGPLADENEINTKVVNIVTSMLVADLKLAELWNLDILGIEHPVTKNQKDERANFAKERFQDSVKVLPGVRYEVVLPWIGGKSKLPTNRIIPEKRLESVVRKLNQSGELKVYQDVFTEWLKEDFIEEVPDVDRKGVHYLPHRAVFKESRTTPVRPVFDASCKSKTFPSLNDCLEKGQNMLELIPSLLFRFRSKAIGVTADVRKAFMMILIHEEDRDYLRFLWWENGDTSKLKVYRHKRVVFGLTCSPFLLAAVISCHLSKYMDSSPTAGQLLKALYVDNCVTSVGTVEELDKFQEEATKLMSLAGMDLRLWESNVFGPSGELLTNRKSGAKEGNTMENFTTNVLGMRWDKFADVLFCEIPQVNLEMKLTKRVLLSVAQRFFDPMGYLAPVTLLPKRLLQQAWETELGWDDILPETIADDFQKWAEDMQEAHNVKIPRWIASGIQNIEKRELHCFSDASKNAYAAVVYVRTVGKEGVKISLLQAKSRVSPIRPQPLSIPRLELMSCTIGSRLCASVKAALGWSEVKTYFWSDSTTALAWISREDEWGTFVANRVAEIRKLTEGCLWYHVPGEMNPADLPSRGCNMSNLVGSKWWEGPLWLYQVEDWPKKEEKPNGDWSRRRCSEIKFLGILRIVNPKKMGYCV